MNRRDFLKTSLSIVLCARLPMPSFAVRFKASDKEIFQQKMNFATHHKLYLEPINRVIVKLAETFLGTPYVGGVLDGYAQEELIINLRELDCFTFVEYVFALALCVKSHRSQFQDFCQTVQTLRYRKGLVKGYASRLHYFTDWINEAQNNNLLKVVSGSQSITKPIFLLSKSLTQKTPSLSDDEMQLLRHWENLLSQQSFSHFPCSQIHLASKQLQSGDIVAFISNLAGIDVNHVGFIYKRANLNTFIHASSTNKKVEIYDGELSEYCRSIKKNSGILIGRAY